MSDDITFCYNNHCENAECERNPKNIKIPYRPHSFAFFDDCKNWDVPETYYMAQGTNEQEAKKLNDG